MTTTLCPKMLQGSCLFCFHLADLLSRCAVSSFHLPDAEVLQVPLVQLKRFQFDRIEGVLHMLTVLLMQLASHRIYRVLVFS